MRLVKQKKEMFCVPIVSLKDCRKTKHRQAEIHWGWTIFWHFSLSNYYLSKRPNVYVISDPDFILFWKWTMCLYFKNIPFEENNSHKVGNAAYHYASQSSFEHYTVTVTQQKHLILKNDRVYHWPFKSLLGHISI